MFTEKTFCQRVTSDEFTKQKVDSTKSALVAMMEAITDDTKMPLKKKKKLIEQFKLHHSELFAKHFQA